MLIAELFIITPNWKQPKYPSKDEQLNWYIHNVEWTVSVLGKSLKRVFSMNKTQPKTFCCKNGFVKRPTIIKSCK